MVDKCREINCLLKWDFQFNPARPTVRKEKMTHLKSVAGALIKEQGPSR